MTPVFCGAHLVAFRAVAGSRMFRQILAQRDQLIDYSNFVSPQFMVAFIYPAYEALFRFAEGSRLQLAVILMLPFLKMIVKYIMLRCTKHMEDMTPEAVIFTVDFFNALYIATCMQSAHSVAAVTIMTITDLLQTTLMLYGLHRRTVTSQDRLRLIIPTRTSTVSESDNLLTALCLLYRNPDNIKRLSRSGVRVRSCLPHRLSASDRSSLNAIVEHEDSFRVLHSSIVAVISPSQNGVNNTKTREKTQISRLVTPLCCRSRSTIYPLETSSRKTKTDSSWEETRPAECPTTQPINRAIILRETLEILFTTECLVLTAYLEAVIPLFYSSYVLAMVNLSNALYHTELAGITYENVGTTVLPVFVFGLLQIISFVLLTSLIKRNCGLRSFHLLAFVLETQMPLIQGKLMFWAGLTLCFRVVHFGKHIYFTDWLSTAVGINVDKLFPFDYAGVDFTFKFSEE
ncbi:hypothetical protein AM587_10000185 [Phytophthora nicotianae]|uniref:Uncharacterized protein n=1 Tax=Phytophthora nicotianae TaxID=4792 RepID=A0A0W8E0A1_PHYNI|nr:hypothetical protein AM587_10000185 [Phytophthora nicotianae]